MLLLLMVRMLVRELVLVLRVVLRLIGMALARRRLLLLLLLLLLKLMRLRLLMLLWMLLWMLLMLGLLLLLLWVRILRTGWGAICSGSNSSIGEAEVILVHGSRVLKTGTPSETRQDKAGQGRAGWSRTEQGRAG